MSVNLEVVNEKNSEVLGSTGFPLTSTHQLLRERRKRRMKGERERGLQIQRRSS